MSGTLTTTLAFTSETRKEPASYSLGRRWVQTSSSMIKGSQDALGWQGPQEACSPVFSSKHLQSAMASAQAAQGSIQLGLPNFQGWNLHKLSEALVLLHD